MKPVEAIINGLRVAMTDARQNESHFESWMILNEAICDAIDALAEQPAQQEPVAWMVYTLDGKSVCVTDNPADFTDAHRALPLYTHPAPAAQPAYDQTALELCEVCGWKTLIPGDVCLNCEHEAAARRQWVVLTDEEIEKLSVENGHATFLNDDEETGIIWFDGDATPFARAIEQKLREKNGGAA